MFVWKYFCYYTMITNNSLVKYFNLIDSMLYEKRRSLVLCKFAVPNVCGVLWWFIMWLMNNGFIDDLFKKRVDFIVFEICILQISIVFSTNLFKFICKIQISSKFLKSSKHLKCFNITFALFLIRIVYIYII